MEARKHGEGETEGLVAFATSQIFSMIAAFIRVIWVSSRL